MCFDKFYHIFCRDPGCTPKSSVLTERMYIYDDFRSLISLWIFCEQSLCWRRFTVLSCKTQDPSHTRFLRQRVVFEDGTGITAWRNPPNGVPIFSQTMAYGIETFSQAMAYSIAGLNSGDSLEPPALYTSLHIGLCMKPFDAHIPRARTSTWRTVEVVSLFVSECDQSGVWTEKSRCINYAQDHSTMKLSYHEYIEEVKKVRLPK